MILEVVEWVPATKQCICAAQSALLWVFGENEPNDRHLDLMLFRLCVLMAHTHGSLMVAKGAVQLLKACLGMSFFTEFLPVFSPWQGLLVH